MILTDKMCLDLAKAYLGKLKHVKPEDINECAEELKRVGERYIRLILTDYDDDERQMRAVRHAVQIMRTARGGHDE